MKKKMIAGGAALCILGAALGVSAAGIIQKVQSEIRSDFTVVIDGEQQHFKNAAGEEVYPILYNGTTYLPVRAIGEMMGKTVYWYENEKRIELKGETPTVTDADVIVTDSPSAPAQGRSYTPDNNPVQGGISQEQAKTIALQKAGLTEPEVTFTKTKLDYENGVQVYEIEFVSGNTEYSAEIRVSDGMIVDWETDYEHDYNYDYNHSSDSRHSQNHSSGHHSE